MGLAEDKVYTHITRNLKKFSTIRVASLADSLTCLVDSDRVIPYFAKLCQTLSLMTTQSCPTSKPYPLLDTLCVFPRMNSSPGRRHGATRQLCLGFIST